MSPKKDDWMTFSNLIPTMMMMEMKTSKSPMNILIIILFISWMMSVNFIMIGKDLWSMIIMIMLFNGGLMITYLFIISMLPKEKKIQTQKKWKQMLMISIMINTPYMKTEKLINETFNMTIWVIIFMTMIISLTTMFIFLIAMDPFKSMKSSF